MKFFIAPFLASFLFLMSCSSDGDSVSDPLAPDPPASGSAPPVETNQANTNYPPAFTGQTRVTGLTTSTKYKTTVITTALTSPWGITTLPDGRFLVTEKAGRMLIVTTAGNISQPITGIPAVNSSGQGGLLGLCLDPGFATNRMVYWSFSEPGPAGNLTAIAKGRLADNERSLEAVTVIYRATPAYAGANHYGGRVVFDRTGNLLVSTGERSDPAIRVQAQSLSSGLGKI